MNQSAVLGAADRMRREWVGSLQQARWSGFFAQVRLSEHEQLFKQLTTEKPKRVQMTDAQIASTMRAWVARSA